MEGEKQSEMELPHFSHNHKLKLCIAQNTDALKVSCHACRRRISAGLFYSCRRCHYFLDKSCAQLPREMIHPRHKQHALTLLPISFYDCLCDICKVSSNRFMYHCSSCRFDVDVRCASIVLNIKQGIEHKGHTEHPLIPLEKPATFECNACDREHPGTSYLCTTCGFWINQKCASMPHTIQLSQHKHSLTLIYSVPDARECEICRELIFERASWAYCCYNCECWVHIKCVPEETVDSILIQIELQRLNSTNLIEFNSRFLRDPTMTSEAEELDPNVITLPNTIHNEESVDLLVTQFIKDMKGLHGEQDEQHNEEAEIRHVSHVHPLILASDKQTDDLLNDEINCNGCAQSILAAPFYRCAECIFFLHKCCVELPNHIQHPCHPGHPLLLTTNFHPFICEFCQLKHTNIFEFKCSPCNFSLDVRCASLPHIIVHKAHEHTLLLGTAGSSIYGRCNGCYRRLLFGYICDLCNLNICVKCALLPGKVTHRYDEHSLTLTYICPNQEVQDYCVICEEEINPRLWFYHCGDCDQSLHNECILDG